MVAKTRPVLVVSVDYGDVDRALVTVVPHTTQVREGEFEVPIECAFLKNGAFMIQGITTHPKAWAIRKLGTITPRQMEAVEGALGRWLGLQGR